MSLGPPVKSAQASLGEVERTTSDFTDSVGWPVSHPIGSVSNRTQVTQRRGLTDSGGGAAVSTAGDPATVISGSVAEPWPRRGFDPRFTVKPESSRDAELFEAAKPKRTVYHWPALRAAAVDSSSGARTATMISWPLRAAPKNA